MSKKSEESYYSWSLPNKKERRSCFVTVCFVRGKLRRDIAIPMTGWKSSIDLNVVLKHLGDRPALSVRYSRRKLSFRVQLFRNRSH